MGNAVIGLYPPRSWLFVASDLFARHLDCQLAGIELGLPRRLAFLRREATVAGHSTSAVDALSVPGDAAL